MPPLQPSRARRTVTLPARAVPVVAEPDVLVVGGGPAGIGAALGAAAAGAQVVLTERYGFLGGNATAALVMPLMSFHTARPAPPAANPLMPQDHGPGEPVVAGALRTLLDRLVAGAGAVEPSAGTGYTVPFDPEVLKSVALDLLDAAGVRFLLHALAVDVADGSPRSVVFATKSGLVAIAARAVVDCTGDGDVAALAGAPYEVGRPEDHLVQPMTLMFRVVGFDAGRFRAYVDGHPGQWRGVHGLWDLVREATEAGDLRLAREDVLFFGTPHPGEISVNSTRVTGVLGTSVWDWTRAEWESRRQMREIAAFLRRYVPGFEKAYVAQSGVHTGVRETRRVLGRYTLTVDDVLGARKFDDVIARGAYPVDIHNPGGRGTTLRRLPAGEAYDVPLRCLLPRSVDGLLVAGRCLSGTHEAHSSYRVMPVAMATGQAAGVCAALAARGERSPGDVAVAAVQQELRRQGADLGRDR